MRLQDGMLDMVKIVYAKPSLVGARSVYFEPHRHEVNFRFIEIYHLMVGYIALTEGRYAKNKNKA